MKNESIRTELEALIRAGRFDQVRKALESLQSKSIPRADLVMYAGFARRVGRFEWSLKLLTPIVRADAHSHSAPATDSEKIEYAEALRRMGGVHEAQKILEAIDSGIFPETLLFRSFGHFSQWDYGAAIPLLRLFVDQSAVSDYQRLVGRLNLTAALIHERELDEASQLLERVFIEARAGQFELVEANGLELSAQIAIERKDYAKALESLEIAKQRLSRAASTVEHLWVSKWQAIVESLEAGEVSESLLQVREEAKRVGHWETVRHCALHEATLRKDPAAFAKVYFGTPYEKYRARMLATVSDWYSPASESFLGEGAPLDLVEARFDDGRQVLAKGHVPHRLLIALSQDAYRPMPLAALFARLFPEEYFNAFSSPNRVHHAVKRLRAALENAGTDISIQHQGGSYRLKPGSSTSIRIPVVSIAASAKEIELGRILEKMGRELFSVVDARELSKGSPSTVKRLLRWGVDSKKLTTIGIGKATRYRAA